MIYLVLAVGTIIGITGASCLVVGIRRIREDVAFTGVVLLLIGSLIVPNAQPISIILTGGTA